MDREKKLGRGLEDFSHLFITSGAKNIEHHSISPNEVTLEKGSSGTPTVIICITSDGNIVERQFLTANLALELSGQGKKVLLLDADFSMPRLCMLLGIHSYGSVLNFICNNREEAFTAGYTNGIKLITLDTDISDFGFIADTKLDSLTKSLRNTEDEADIVLVNTAPSLIHNMAVNIFKVCSDFLVITPQPVHAMINAYRIIKTIFQVNHDANVCIIPSRIETPEQSGAVFEKIQKIAGKYLNKPLYNSGYFPEDEKLSHAIERREQISLSSSSPDTARCIKEIAKSVLKIAGRSMEIQSSEGKRNSLAEKLFKIVPKRRY